MAGLQGTGKTTTAAKLAAFLKNKGGRVMLVATDVYRPAAIEQLVVLGGQVGVPVFERGLNVPPADIARYGWEAERMGPTCRCPWPCGARVVSSQRASSGRTSHGPPFLCQGGSGPGQRGGHGYCHHRHRRTTAN